MVSPLESGGTSDQPPLDRLFGPRTARDVVEDHLRLWQTGEVAADVLRNFDEAAISLTVDGALRGRAGAQAALDELRRQLPDARLHLRSCQAEGEVALVEWGAVGANGWVRDGVCTFVVRDGRIRAQTLHYTVHRRPQAHLEWTEGW